MIVQPDFLTHWKTQALVNELGAVAPLYVIALWAHCQQRRSDRINNATPAMMKAICRAEGDGAALIAALESCGFVDRDGADLIAHDWSETNSRLLHNWSVGTLGGRPPKPKDNPRVSSTKPSREEKRRVEKSREDQRREEPPEEPTGANARASSAFETFYESYPRKVAKSNAAKAWKTKKLDPLLPVILAAIQTQRTWPAFKGEERYIPHPATWLNAERWNDAPPVNSNGAHGGASRMRPEELPIAWGPTGDEIGDEQP